MGIWAKRRKNPYSKAGLKRLKCVRCGKPASAQWQICSDGNNYRPLCDDCDIDLNRIVLEWAGHPAAADLIEKYKRFNDCLA